MKLCDLIEAIEFQGEYKVVYFDDEKCERVEITYEEAADHTVQYIYPEKDCVYIEVERTE